MRERQPVDTNDDFDNVFHTIFGAKF
jgi:hypothetical protein